MTSKLYNEVKKLINDGTYKLVRLIHPPVEGESRPPVVEFNGVAGGVKEKALARLDYIKLKCDKTLPAGRYILECRISAQNKTAVEHYPITVNRTVVLTNDIEDKTKEQQEDMSTIDMEEYLRLLNENSALKTQVAQLELEIKYAQKYASQNTTLADGSPIPAKKDGMEILADVFGEIAPSLMNMGERYFGLQEQKLNLEDKRLSSGLIKKSIGNKKGMTKILKKKQPAKTFDQEVQEEVEYMNSLSEEDFDSEMDELEKQDPELYEAVCEELDITDEGEEEEENLNDEGGEEEDDAE